MGESLIWRLRKNEVCAAWGGGGGKKTEQCLNLEEGETNHLHAADRASVMMLEKRPLDSASWWSQVTLGVWCQVRWLEIEHSDYRGFFPLWFRSKVEQRQ